jgi:tRNA(Arg) A34 adenosine deaminase TadA
MLDVALQAAAQGMSSGETPIGAALFDAAGNHIVSGHNQSLATGDGTMHAEMSAFRMAAQLGKKLAPGTILASTLEPCVMCLGAAMEVGIDVVVYGLSAPADGGLARVWPPTSPENLMCRVTGGVRAREARELFVKWRQTVATPTQLPYVDQLLESTTTDGTPKPQP